MEKFRQRVSGLRAEISAEDPLRTKSAGALDRE
jgi:hypothetical protein